MFWSDSVIELNVDQGDDITLNCTLAAHPNNVTFHWLHTGANGSRVLDTDHVSIDDDEIVSSTVTLSDLHMYSYGTVACTGTNEVGAGGNMTFHIRQMGEECFFLSCVHTLNFDAHRDLILQHLSFLSPEQFYPKCFQGPRLER